METATVHDALRYLARRCDYAGQRDHAGYNKIDTQFGHDLAEQENLTYGQQLAALKMLRKYKVQLEAGGITLPDSIPAPAASEPFRVNGHGGITLRAGQLAISFPSIPPEADRTFLKTFRGWRFDGATKAWLVPLSALDQVSARFPSLPVAPEIGAEMTARQAEAEAEAERQASITQQLLAAAGDLAAPLSPERTLFPFQREGVEKLLRDRRMILADDMGLGKTIQALVAAKAWHQAFDLPVIVIAPVSLRDNWLREAETVGVAIEVHSWAKVPQSPETDFMLIADEAHYAQSGGKSKRGQDFLALAGSEHCQATYCLTGTPIKNGRPSNLFPLLQAVRHPLACNKSKYEERYCAAHATRWTKWDVTGAAHLDELHLRTKDQMLRRLKKEVLRDLPAKTRVLRKAEISTEARRTYDAHFAELRAEYQRRIGAGEIMGGAEALVLLNHLRHAGSIAKVESAIELAQEVLEQGGQPVLFTEFLTSADALHKDLGGELLTGESTDRQAMVDRFQAGISKVFVGTIKAGGVGITLTAADTVILVDRPWTSGDAIQAEDRLHRIGQKESVTAIWLQANGTDEMIDALLQAKQERINLVLQGKRKTLRGVGGSAMDAASEILSALMD